MASSRPRAFGEGWQRQPAGISPGHSFWRPAADVIETASEVIVLVELAGIDHEQLDVLLFEDALIVEGERRLPAHAAGVYHAAEIRQGQVRLELALGDDRIKGKQVRILLVEDHDTTRRVLARLLSLNGWEVRTAATVAEGLDLLDQGPDCVILDLMLPDGDGETVLRRVRDAGLQTRVVVTSATGDEARLEQVRQMGPAAVLQKPVDVEEICRVCETATD